MLDYMTKHRLSWIDMVWFSLYTVAIQEREFVAGLAIVVIGAIISGALETIANDRRRPADVEADRNGN